MTTKIAEICTKVTSVVVWSPLTAGLVAVGAKESSLESKSSTSSSSSTASFPAAKDCHALEFYSFLDETPECQGSLSLTEQTARFASLAWSTYTGGEGGGEKHGTYPQGILAAGMMDGTVLLMDPHAVLRGDSSQKSAILATLPATGTGPIPALQFSALSTHFLCTGSYQGRVTIWDAADPTHPIVHSHYTAAAEITAVAWNTAVPHIVATAAADGLVTVWDMSSQGPWCEIQAAAKLADIRWNPKEGLHLLTASADDRNPVLHLWDLGTSTTVPLATLSGHTAGILATAWCPHDDSLLLSVAKDHHIYLWDLLSLSAVAEWPMETAPEPAVATAHSANALFASGRPGWQEQKQMRYHVAWSPLQRGVALTCRLDKKIQVHNLLSLCTATGRPPAWMTRRSSVSTAFGGLVVSCRADSSMVTLQTIAEQPDLVLAATAFDAAQQHESLLDVSAQLQATARTKEDAAFWGFLPALLDVPPRPLLLRHLGLDPEEIAAAAQQFAAHEAADASADGVVTSQMGSAAEALVQKALLVGNFAAAVDCCLSAGNYADALLLAACGGGDLWATTQERYLEQQSAQRPYLALVSGIVRHPLEEWVVQSDWKLWRETLAMVSTYASTAEEFAHLSAVLGDILLQAGDDAAASLCFMCAMSLERTVPYWKKQLDQQVCADFTSTADLLALHDFVCKVSVFSRAIGVSSEWTPEMEVLFTRYAEALAQQGLLVSATKYCYGGSIEAKILRDRLYRSRCSQACYNILGTPPEFPYVMMDIQKIRGLVFVQPQEMTKEPEILTNGHGDHPQQPVTDQGYPQSRQPAVSAPSLGSEDALPLGWIALQDPSSGNMYYANETTGETTWDRPQAPIRAPFSAPQMSSFQPDTGMDASQRSQMAQPTNVAQPRPKASIVSKYGDGFVSSASNPELAHQYGNIGTSNPYGGTARPGPAAVQPLPKAPVSGSLNLDSLQLSNHHKSIKDTLFGCSEALKQTSLNVVEKKQLDEAEKGVAILVKKLNREEISDAMVDQVFALVNAISQHDFATALGYQTTMANSEWRDHKDWLKGIKVLIQLASKKF